MSSTYIPDVGDMVWLHFDPQAGREQSGHRPALVLSPRLYNQKTSLMVCCPLTTRIKGYPFEVLVNLEGISSAVLSDQVKNLDWKQRQVSFKAKAPASVVNEVRKKIKALLSF